MLPVRRRAIVAASAAVLVGTVLAGCSGGDGADTKGHSTPTSSAALQSSPEKADSGKSTGSGSKGDPAVNGLGATGLDAANLPEPMATVVVPRPDRDVTETKVELLKLEPWDDTVLVGVFRITPEGDLNQTVKLSRALGERWDPRLIDLEGLVVHKSIDGLGTNSFAVESKLGEPMYAWAAFAPVPSGRTIHIQPSSLGPVLEGLTAP